MSVFNHALYYTEKPNETRRTAIIINHALCSSTNVRQKLDKDKNTQKCHVNLRFYSWSTTPGNATVDESA